MIRYTLYSDGYGTGDTVGFLIVLPQQRSSKALVVLRMCVVIVMYAQN